MLTYYDPGLTMPSGRAHPWTHSERDPSCRHCDFVAHPELIRSSIEDVRDLGDVPAALRLYELLEWVNGPESLLETNDCGVKRPKANNQPNIPYARCIDARVMLFHRDHALNVLPASAEWLSGCIGHYLNQIDANWLGACVGVNRQPTLFLTLPESGDREGMIQNLTVWAWGNSDEVAWSTLARTFRNILVACQAVVSEVRESQGQPSEEKRA